MLAGACLSDLPDDMLCHILSFAPLKEAASTSALARRWRTLWLQSGAINLDSRTRSSNSNDRCQRSSFQRHARAAMAAYRSSGFRLMKLTFYHEEWGTSKLCDHLTGLLSSRAAQHLEELYFGQGCYGSMRSYGITTLPAFKALRVLHISNCIDAHGPEDMVVLVDFPRLTQLRLYLCTISREGLQAIIDASPLLNTLQLEQVHLSWCRELQNYLSLPKVTTLLLQNFDYGNRIQQTNLELDAPNLRCFTYKGIVAPLLLKSPAPHITRVELHFNVSYVHRHNQGKWNSNLSKVHRRDVACQLFWQFVSNFRSAKVLMLSFEPPDHHTPAQ